MHLHHRLLVAVFAVTACAATATLASDVTAGAIADPQTHELDRLRVHISIAQQAVPVFRTEAKRQTSARLTPGQRTQYDAQSKYLTQAADRLQTLLGQMQALASQKNPKLRDLEQMNERFCAFENDFKQTSARYGGTSLAAKARHDKALAALK